MITCPACGKENEDSAFECKRCRAPLREDHEHHEHHEEHHAAPAEEAPPAEEAAPAEPAEPQASSELGTVCRRCEAFNEPGVRNCTACGYDLFAGALQEAVASGEQQSLSADTEEPTVSDKTPPQPYAAHDAEPAPDVTPADGQPSISSELSALELSDEEAAEAGLSHNGVEDAPMDKTPPQAFAAPEAEAEPEPPPPAPPPRKPEVAAAAGGGAAVSRRAPEPPPPAPPAARPAPEPAAAPAEKVCSSCGASNPPAAKFCFDCGTPFAKKAAAPAPEAPKAAPELPKPAPVPEPVRPVAKAAPLPPPSIQVDSSIHVDEELAAHQDVTDSTAESQPVSLDEPPEELPAEEAMAAEEAPAEAAEELPAEEAMPEEAPPAEEEPVAAESVAEPIEEEPPAPFAASLVVEKGGAQGTAYALAHMTNSVGASGAHVDLGEDAFVAPHAATVTFAEDHLTVRDEGSANGVFVKLREPAELQAGDQFIAGERLFRFEGPADLPREPDGETPFLGAPRPQAAAVRIVEVLAGGKTGRTCHRSGPVVTIGRTGCDMNFPADSQLAAKHVEIRLGEDGAATLVDLGQGPSGVWLRVRSQSEQPLQAGDLLQIGEQQLRVDLG